MYKSEPNLRMKLEEEKSTYDNCSYRPSMSDCLRYSMQVHDDAGHMTSSSDPFVHARGSYETPEFSLMNSRTPDLRQLPPIPPLVKLEPSGTDQQLLQQTQLTMFQQNPAIEIKQEMPSLDQVDGFRQQTFSAFSGPRFPLGDIEPWFSVAALDFEPEGTRTLNNMETPAEIRDPFFEDARMAGHHNSNAKMNQTESEEMTDIVKTLDSYANGMKDLWNVRGSQNSFHEGSKQVKRAAETNHTKWEVNVARKGHRTTFKSGRPRLCQFLLELLENPGKYSYMIDWLDQDKGIFKFLNSGEVARMWGRRRNKPQMKYENFARSLRTYIAKGILTKPRSKLVYRFAKIKNWSKEFSIEFVLYAGR